MTDGAVPIGTSDITVIRCRRALGRARAHVQAQAPARSRRARSRGGG